MPKGRLPSRQQKILWERTTDFVLSRCRAGHCKCQYAPCSSDASLEVTEGILKLWPLAKDIEDLLERATTLQWFIDSVQQLLNNKLYPGTWQLSDHDQVEVLYISGVNHESHLTKTVLGTKGLEPLSWPGHNPLLSSFQSCWCLIHVAHFNILHGSG